MGVSLPLRVVLDTNVLVSALLYEAGEMAWLPHALRAGSVIPLAAEAVIAELTRILLQLGQKKFHLEPDAINTILQRYLSFTEMVNETYSINVRLPQCKDRDDQKFLELACRGNADVLVTSDNALLGLARKTPFAILNPVKFRMRVVEVSDDTALRGG
jgi:putative PIN family toxin of toxin-antitoxin system